MSEKTPALATTPAPLGKPDGPGLFHVKGLELPPYIQNLARAMMRQGHTKSEAIQLALGAVERWKDGGGGNVSPEVRAAAGAAWAQWLAARGIAKAKPNKSDHANDVDAVDLAQPRVPVGNEGAGQFYGEPDYPAGPRTREVPKVTAENLPKLRKQLEDLTKGGTELSASDSAILARDLALAAARVAERAVELANETGNSMTKTAPTVPADNSSLEDRLHKKLVDKGIKPGRARKLAKSALARVIRERITGQSTPAAAAPASMSSELAHPVELAASADDTTSDDGNGSVEDRIYRKLIAKGMKPGAARAMAKRAAQRAKNTSADTSKTANMSATRRADAVDLASTPPRLRAEARQKAADDGTALPDGSWPIRSLSELSDAIQSWGRAVASGRAATVKAWMLRRAKALDAAQEVVDRINALETAA